MRIAAISAAVFVLAAVLVIGLRQASNSGEGQADETGAAPTLIEAQRSLRGSPSALAAIHKQGSQLLPGGPAALDDRLQALRGYPVVVNVWASWCGPCRQEMPVFEQVSADRGRKVAFLGVDLKDNIPAAKRLLAEFPVSYPSYGDPDAEFFSDNKLAGVPSTIFYSRSGKRQLVHSGPYLSADDLNTDIDRYALVAK
jgi:cytochrome c biogenesis protein CcmG, thiol:disulfide interchange protein DsbE